MLFYVLAVMSSAYTMFAIVVLFAHSYIKRTQGITGLAEQVNKLAGTRKIVVFEIYSYLSISVWFVLVVPWVDLFTFGYLSHFKDNGLDTYLGLMTSKQADAYFAVMAANILGARAALTFAELADMLRRGRVRLLITHGWLEIWKPE